MPCPRPLLVCVIFVFNFFLEPTSSFAGAAAVAIRQKQMQAMQQAAQQRAMQEALAQRQQQEIQAAQEQAIIAQIQQQQVQAVAQQIIAQIQQQQVAAAQQVVAMQVAAQQQMYANVKRSRQQQSDVQQAAIAAALAQKYQQEVVAQAIAQKMALDAAKMAQIQQLVQERAEAQAYQMLQAQKEVREFQTAQTMVQNRPFEPVKPGDVKDVVDIADVWRKMDNDSRVWALLIDNQAKAQTVGEYMDRFAKEGVKIQSPAIEYVHMIDDMAIQNPALLTRPFKDILQLVAIMQYDFDNGINRDLLAKKMLGEGMYLANKKRLGK